MVAQKAPRNPFTGVLFVAVFLLALAFLPRLAKKTEFQFNQTKLPSSPSASRTFAMEKRLKVLYSPEQKFSTKEVSLSEIAGNNTLLVNFWATWCPPCLDELPSIEFLDRQLKRGQERSLPKLVTISVDATAEPIFELFKTLDFKAHFLVLHDPEGTLMANAVGTSKFPETYWLSPKGAILYQWIGPQDWLSASILRQLAKTP